MKIRTLFLTLFLAISYSVGAQGDSFQENTIKYLKMNGTQSQYSNAYDDMFVMLAQQFSSANVPETEWASLKGNKEKSVNEVITLLASAYQKHFTEGDIKKMVAFYSTYVGKKMVTNPNDLAPEEKEEIRYFFNGDVGKKLSAKQAALTADISQISEYWSRDLFKATMESLSAKGYNPQH